MRSSADGSDADRRRPRLAPGWERVATALNPAEGFLLSRIDGHTPWAVLREIGGLLPEEADLVLESWVQTGLVLIEEGQPRANGAATNAPTPEAMPSAGEDAIDPSLDLDVEIQRSALAFEARLAHASYHELLGVERGAEPREIKRAYFRLSKKFHPDRYFRRNVGAYALRLDRIFKHVALAYELLSDPATRVEIERSIASGPPGVGAYRRRGPGAPDESRAPRPQTQRAPTRMENLERLRSRFRMPQKVLSERRFKARQFFRSAQTAAHLKNWLEAAASARLAIAFDPWNPEYKESFAGIQAEVHAARALELLEQADGAKARADALKLLEEAIHYRPTDAALQARAARLAAELDQLESAQEYAESACELEPESAESQLVLCRVLRRRGDLKAARAVLDTAAKLAPKDPEVAAERKLLRRGR